MVVQRAGTVLALNADLRRLILRLPWKRQHLGFILPHIGLVVLFLGCFLSRHYGVEATVAVAERQSVSEAYKGLGQHLELDGQQHFVLVVPGRRRPSTPGKSAWSSNMRRGCGASRRRNFMCR